MRIAVKRNIFKAREHKNRNLFAKPIFYYVVAIVLFICAIIVHPWDLQYKTYITTHRFLDIFPLNQLMDLIRVFGNAGITAIIALIFAAYGYRKLAYRIAVSLIIMGIIVNILKPTVARERPNHRNCHSFPSGDAATAAAFFPPMAAESNYFIPGTVIITPAVGFLRTYDNWHWLSDVITGIGTGFIGVGFALFFCEKKNRIYKLLCRKIKPRHYAILSLIVLISCFLPELIKGGGKYLNFTSFYAPALYVWLGALYIPFIFSSRSESCKRIPEQMNNIKVYYSEKVITTNKPVFPTFNKGLTVLFLLLALFLIIPPWIISSIGNIAFASSGIGIAILVLMIAVARINKSGNLKRVKPTISLGTAIIIIFALLTLLPAILRS